jgi:hypothetical protein
MYGLNNKKHLSEIRQRTVSGKERSSLERKFHHCCGFGGVRKVTCGGKEQ